MREDEIRSILGRVCSQLDVRNAASRMARHGVVGASLLVAACGSSVDETPMHDSGQTEDASPSPGGDAAADARRDATTDPTRVDATADAARVDAAPDAASDAAKLDAARLDATADVARTDAASDAAHIDAADAAHHDATHPIDAGPVPPYMAPLIDSGPVAEYAAPHVDSGPIGVYMGPPIDGGAMPDYMAPKI